MKKAISMLDEVKESIINAYEIKTGLPRDKISRLMDNESWFNATKAKELGFIDKIMFSSDEGENDDEPDNSIVPQAMMFSRMAVQNSLMSKLIQKNEPVAVPVNQLRKRLNLLPH